MNQTQHIWSVICSSFSNDAQSNNVSLFNLIERISINISAEDLAKAKEAGADGIIVPIPFAVVSRFNRKNTSESEKFDYRLQIITPEGKAAMGVEREVEMTKGVRNLRVGSTFTNLGISKSGDYQVAVETKGKNDTEFMRIYEIPLEIEITSNPK